MVIKNNSGKVHNFEVMTLLPEIVLKFVMGIKSLFLFLFFWSKFAKTLALYFIVHASF